MKPYTDELRAELATAVGPLMAFLARNHSPHTTAIVTSETAEILGSFQVVRRHSPRDCSACQRFEPVAQEYDGSIKPLDQLKGTE